MVVSLSFPYNTERIPVPRLISSLTGQQEGEIGLYFQDKLDCPAGEAEDTSRTPVKRIPSTTHTNRIASMDLDLTGSPLKADFDPNEEFDNSDDEEYLRHVKKAKTPLYSGLPVNSARVLLSKLNTKTTLPDSFNFVLCSPTPGKSNPVLYLGNRKVGGRLTEILQTTWSGPLPGKAVTGVLEAVSAEHTALAAKNRIKVDTRAEYRLSGGEEGESSLVLECSWGRSTALLESPPPDAITKLKISMIAGDDRFACDAQNAEIDQLEGLISGLKGEGLVWTGRDEDSSLEDEVLEVLESARKLRPSLANQDTECENVLSLQSRQDVDITDMLWTVLSRAQSYAELTHAFDFLLHTVLREEIRPFIYTGNRSGMADILRDIVRSGTLPDMSGSRPLLLLIEMGIEKLKRDSTHFLLSGDLVSKEAVDPYLIATDPSESLDLIKRLHMIVELAFACQTYLSLPPAALKSVVHSALVQFKGIQETNKINIEFPIQTSDVKAQLENGNACFWQVRFTSEELTSVVQLQTERPAEVHPAAAAAVAQTSEDQADLDYYILNHVQIKQN